MITVELTKLVRSRRTWVTILLIDALPTLVAVLLAVTELGPRPGTGPAFLSAVMTDARRSRARPSRARCATCWSARSAAPASWSPSWSA